MDAELAQTVAEREWYHTMELPGGIVTPGFFDHRPYVKRYGLPEDLTGKRVLDAGTFDGFFAFEMERRGAAEVVAIDVPDLESLDWPEPLRRSGVTRFQPKHENFEIARRALGSNVKREFISIYDVSSDRLGTFDYIFVGSLLIHLRDPVRALMSLKDACRGTIHVAEETHRGLDIIARKMPVAKFRAISWDMTWWIPNRACLKDWLEAAGFTSVRHGQTFVLPFANIRGGVRHSMVFAEPFTESV